MLQEITPLMEKLIPLTDARAKLSDIVNEVMYKGDTYIISKLGKPAVAVVPLDVLEAWQKDSKQVAKKQLFDVIDTIQQRHANSPAAQMDEEEFSEFLNECIEEVRTERRTEQDAS